MRALDEMGGPRPDGGARPLTPWRPTRRPKEGDWTDAGAEAGGTSPRSLCPARADLRPRRRHALAGTGAARPPLPRLAPSSRRPRARRGDRDGAGRGGAPAAGIRGDRPRSEPRDAGDRTPSLLRRGRPDQCVGGGAPARFGILRPPHGDARTSLCRRPEGDAGRTRARGPSGWRCRLARVRRPAGSCSPPLEPLRPNGVAARRSPAPARLAGGRRLPGRVDPRLLGAPPARAPTGVVARGGPPGGGGEAAEPRHRRRRLGTEAVSPPDRAPEGASTRPVPPVARPAWYALSRGGWRDYVTLLHPPYTAWHLSYVVIGGCLAPLVAWGRLRAPPAAVALALGVGAHALDELNGRPLRTKIPDRVLVALAAVSIGGACAIGVVGAVTFEAWLALLIPLGLFLVLAYNLELAGGRFHSDLWFGLAWGGFPVLCGYAAVAGELRPVALVAAAFAVLLSLAQRALSSHVRFVRRRVVAGGRGLGPPP